jgi:hypothetical protein
MRDVGKMICGFDLRCYDLHGQQFSEIQHLGIGCLSGFRWMNHRTRITRPGSKSQNAINSDNFLLIYF